MEVRVRSLASTIACQSTPSLPSKVPESTSSCTVAGIFRISCNAFLSYVQIILFLPACCPLLYIRQIVGHALGLARFAYLAGSPHIVFFVPYMSTGCCLLRPVTSVRRKSCILNCNRPGSTILIWARVFPSCETKRKCSSKVAWDY